MRAFFYKHTRKKNCKKKVLKNYRTYFRDSVKLDKAGFCRKAFANSIEINYIG